MNLSWKTCFRIGATLMLLYIAILFMPDAVTLVGKFFAALSPMIIGASIAYIINILMSIYEKHYFPKHKDKKIVAKTKRGVCILLAFTTLIAVVVLIGVLIVPELISCVSTMVSVVPPFIQKVLNYTEDISWIPPKVIDALEKVDWKGLISGAVGMVSGQVTNVVTIITTAIASVFSFLVTALFSVIFSIYLLTGKDRMRENSKRLMHAYLPKKSHGRLLHLISVFNVCFHRFIVGQCVEALILGTLCTVGMLILQLPYATMIGALIAFTALVPIAGAYIGAAIGAFMILTVSPMKALIFLIFLIILQQFENNVIYPRVVGTSLGLPALWVLLAVTVGGGLFGVPGMLIGVPLTAALYRLVKEDLVMREIMEKREAAKAQETAVREEK